MFYSNIACCTHCLTKVWGIIGSFCSSLGNSQWKHSNRTLLSHFCGDDVLCVFLLWSSQLERWVRLLSLTDNHRRISICGCPALSFYDWGYYWETRYVFRIMMDQGKIFFCFPFFLSFYEGKETFAISYVNVECQRLTQSPILYDQHHNIYQNSQDGDWLNP